MDSVPRNYDILKYIQMPHRENWKIEFIDPLKCQVGLYHVGCV